LPGRGNKTMDIEENILIIGFVLIGLTQES